MTAAQVIAGLTLALQLGAQTLPAELAARFAGHDVDGDGTAELEIVRPLGAAGDEHAPHVVVLVEQRLLDGPAEELALRLSRFAADLGAAGWRAELLAVSCYAGPRHQDGRIVLALRRLLRAWRDATPSLAGAILVGHFPDALLVRTCNWRKRGPVEVRGSDGEQRAFPEDTRFLRRIAECVAQRCDLVLADLDGGWESLYFEPETALPGLVAVWPDGVPERGGPCEAAERKPVRFADAFHVADGRAELADGAVVIDDAHRDHECAEQDRARSNAIAQPDIAVSRIDARGAARAADGKTPDTALERKLLVEYFDRNHAYRQARDRAAFKPASIAWGLGSGMRSLRRAARAWQDFDEPGYDVTEHVDLVALVEWLRRPAVLRALRAHSDPHGARFAKTDVEALAAAIGAELPTALARAARKGRADHALYRELWARAALPADPYLLIHTGCDALSPPGAGSLPWSDPRYGARQHAESMLFFTPCLAIVGRAKVFYDEPRGFSAALAEGATFGAAWRRYFEIEAGAESWREVGGDIGRKRAYFWSLLGDWTLRLTR